MDLVIAVLIVIAVQLVMFLFLRGRIHQELNATSLLKDVQDEVDGMVRELNLSAERNIGLLEARIEEMEGLLAQADQKLVLMARELERREKTAEVYTQLKRVDLPPAPLVEPEPEPEPTAPVLEPEPVVEWKPAVPVEVEPVRHRSLKERVLGFRDQGLDPGAIASATGATRGEVDLILSLNPLRSTE
jgi:hypothetical protein